MKRVIEPTEDLLGDTLLGEHICLWCECYIYAGKLAGVNETSVLLEEAKVVYETGPLSKPGFKDAQPLPGPWYVQMAKIESFGVMS